jgi:hypothetical protein
MNNIRQIIMAVPESINLSDPCLFWARRPDEYFIQNVKDLGQAEPVLISFHQDEAVLIAGYKRVLAQKSLGRKVMAVEIPPPDPYSRGLIYLAANHGQAIGPDRIISALRYFAGLGIISDQVWRLLEIAPGSRPQTLWQNWLALPRSWDMLLARGNISLESSRILKNLGMEELELLYPLFAQLSWSRNNCLNLLTWLTEKGRIDNTGPGQVIENLKLENILQSGLSPADKIKSILMLVFQARFPVFSDMKNRLALGLRSVSARTGWRLEHRDEFESTAIEISARIQSGQDLKKALLELEEITKSGILDQWPVKSDE